VLLPVIQVCVLVLHSRIRARRRPGRGLELYNYVGVLVVVMNKELAVVVLLEPSSTSLSLIPCRPHFSIH
jgi:hypothetical protein